MSNIPCAFRMPFDVSELRPDYHFQILGSSFIGAPADETVLFLTGKLKSALKNLTGHRHCLVFIEEGIPVSEELQAENCFVFSEDAQAAYGLFARKIAARDQALTRGRKYTLTPEGYTIGENVTMGEGCLIEPGCLLDHDVVIGNGAELRFGTVIRDAVIGDNFRTGEYAVIGTEPYFFAGHPKFRIPAFGKVIIGNDVEVGSHAVIEKGFNANTELHDHVKLDAHVSLGHDDVLREGAQMTCAATLGGLVNVGEGSYIGMNATVRQRLNVGDDALVGMGATVVSNVKDGTTVIGNPARKLGL